MIEELTPGEAILLGMLDCPNPCWMKSPPPESRMLVINQAYENLFGIVAEEYTNDTVAWGEEIAKEFLIADTEAFDFGKPVFYWETLLNSKTGNWEKVLAVKWPVFDFARKCIGVAGMVTRRKILGKEGSPVSEKVTEEESWQ